MGTEKKGYKVLARVVEVKTPCNAGHRVDDQAIFNFNRVEGKLCFYSMCSMMAKVHSLRYGGRFPWLEDPNEPARHGCPDGSNVVFELSRIMPDKNEGS